MTKSAIRMRNLCWRENRHIPSWVDVSTVGLDQFFTKSQVAQYCRNSLAEVMRGDGADPDQYSYLEPSAGTGSFYQYLPQDRRIGLDVEPLCEGLETADFLSWSPDTKVKRLAVVGNPPFGYRGWLALAFLNRAALWADYVGMILPMAFQSEGKGSPRLRVEGLRLVHSEQLPQGSFVDVGGTDVKINALWQVWQRGVNNPPKANTCERYIDLFTVDKRQERLCGVGRIGEADFFIQRTFFGDPPRLVETFDLVKYVCGYGIIIKESKDHVVDAFSRVNWFKYSNLAAHNCHHISMYHIHNALHDEGLCDG
jgi:hypothetical protein